MTMSDMYHRYRRWFYLLIWLCIILILYLLLYPYIESRFNPNNKPSSAHVGNENVVILKANSTHSFVVSGKINGQQVVFLLDTGASMVAVPLPIAKKTGLNFGIPTQIITASGTAKGYFTKINRLELGDIVLYNLPATITPATPHNVVLLGMNALKTLEFTKRGNHLILKQP